MNRLIDVQLACSAWGVRQAIEACAGLSSASFSQPLDVGPPPGSVQGALAHTIEAMFYFADNFSGRAYHERPHFQEAQRTVAGMQSLLAEAESELRGAIHGFLFANEDNLDAPVHWSYAKRDIPASLALAQVFDHATHHRVQAMHMLKKLGVSPLPEASPLDWPGPPRS
jgi:uncharacterized damage-inducible protein DinB